MTVTRRTLLIACALIPALVAAQEPPYPQRGNVEITVLFPAGTSADVTARLLAEGMSKQLGQTVLVVNRPGAGGAIGYKHVASQKPDGYALVWNSNSISTTYHSGQLAFDYTAFDPVARVLVESPVVAVRGDAKWKSLGDLMADAKARPGIITVGNSGIGSHTHISSVALFHAAGVKVVDAERFNRTDQSVTGQTLKMIAAKPDAMLIAAVGGPAARIVPSTLSLPSLMKSSVATACVW